jgi:hypothetical protein
MPISTSWPDLVSCPDSDRRLQTGAGAGAPRSSSSDMQSHLPPSPPVASAVESAYLNTRGHGSKTQAFGQELLPRFCRCGLLFLQPPPTTRPCVVCAPSPFLLQNEISAVLPDLGAFFAVCIGIKSVGEYEHGQRNFQIWLACF